MNPAGKNKKPATIFNLMKVNRVAQNPNFFSSGRSVNISLFWFKRILLDRSLLSNSSILLKIYLFSRFDNYTILIKLIVLKKIGFQ